MAVLDDLTLGRYLPAGSPLHRLDPRLKLAGLPLLVVAVFAGGGQPERLAVLAILALILGIISRIETRVWFRGIWALRWLLLFSLLLHLFFSPGRTILGVAWLSLDGLRQGLTVGVQLVLAILFSSLLTLTTAPREIAAAFARLFSPLERIGLRAGESACLLLLILHFIPILQEEASAAAGAARLDGQYPGRGTPADRARAWRQIVAPLVLRLADRADALARSAAAGAPLFADAMELGPLRRPGDFFALGTGICTLLLVFSL